MAVTRASGNGRSRLSAHEIFAANLAGHEVHRARAFPHLFVFETLDGRDAGGDIFPQGLAAQARGMAVDGLAVFLAIAIFSITSASRLITPGKFITSARNFTSFLFRRDSTSAGPREAPAVSKGVAGTQEGAPKGKPKGTVLTFSI